ncbi:MAG: metallophosphoesterase [Fimbriimonadaceae bacterium]
MATLIYGALVESNRLVVERRRLRLRNWPTKLAGVRLAVLADLHVRDRYSAALASRAVALALAEKPDYVLIPGDLVAGWAPGVIDLLAATLSPLADANLTVIVSMGNHDYELGSSRPIVGLCERLGFKVLRNDAWRDRGITFAGIDSANLCLAEPRSTMESAKKLGDPIIVLWHEPDPVDVLPQGAQLMVSGHSHGGQFTFPGGFTPMHTVNGAKYVRGFYPNAPTPIYVSRGVGTTGPPSRLNCPPEVSILELGTPSSWSEAS